MKSLVRVYLVFVITLLVAVSGPDALIAQSPSVPFLVHNGGAVSETTSGTSAALADSLPLGGEGQSQSTFSPPRPAGPGWRVDRHGNWPVPLPMLPMCSSTGVSTI